jgi:hypothetical protein
MPDIDAAAGSPMRSGALVIRPHTITAAINGGAVTLLGTVRSERAQDGCGPGRARRHRRRNDLVVAG